MGRGVIIALTCLCVSASVEARSQDDALDQLAAWASKHSSSAIRTTWLSIRPETPDVVHVESATQRWPTEYRIMNATSRFSDPGAATAFFESATLDEVRKVLSASSVGYARDRSGVSYEIYADGTFHRISTDPAAIRETNKENPLARADRSPWVIAQAIANDARWQRWCSVQPDGSVQLHPAGASAWARIRVQDDWIEIIESGMGKDTRFLYTFDGFLPAPNWKGQPARAVQEVDMSKADFGSLAFSDEDKARLRESRKRVRMRCVEAVALRDLPDSTFQLDTVGRNQRDIISGEIRSPSGEVVRPAPQPIQPSPTPIQWTAVLSITGIAFLGVGGVLWVIRRSKA